MKKHIMKKRMTGVYAMICAGMLLFAGCAGREANTETETTAQSESNDETAVDDAIKTQEQETFTDGNDMISSANLTGPASECSDTGCMINTSSFASVEEDGVSSSEDGGNMMVVYTDETLFQKGTVKSDGSSYSLEDSEKSELQDNDFILCYGNQQADGSYLADRIIMIEFN